MGWRYRKSINFGPIRLNVGRRGIGQSVGVRGLRIGQSATGERYLNVSIPGTGWSYRKSLGRRPARNRPIRATTFPSQPPTLPSSTPPPASSPPPASPLPDWMQQD